MSNQPPTIQYPSYSPGDKDAEHIRILSICWYIVAGLQCLGICGGLAYIVLGLIGVAASNHNNMPPAAIFLCMGIALMLLSATFAFLSYKVGRSLAARTSHTLCFVMAILVCLSFPIGTVLGVFTLIVLSRTSVKESFH